MESKLSNVSDGPPDESEVLRNYLDKYEEAALAHTEASLSPDHRKANKSHDIIMGVVTYLKEHGELLQLRHFLSHPSEGVRVWAASNLLSTELNSEAISTLKQVAKGNNIIAFAAEMTLSEWAKGNLRP
jgi:hypothetical protein